jgi:hypothetical protein
MQPSAHDDRSLRRTGIIHMEASHPFNFTLGDFFSVWGVKLGPAQLGGLSGYGGDHLRFYLNGKPLSNQTTARTSPARHVGPLARGPLEEPAAAHG